MSELNALLQAAQALRESAEPFVVATVMQVRGSAYRRPGARMLATEQRWLAGSISGGCLEGDVVQRGFFRTRDQRAVLVSYDARADEDDVGGRYGLGCDGIVDVLIERIDAHTHCNPLEFIARCQRDQTRGVVATVFQVDGDAARVGDKLLFCESAPYLTTLDHAATRIASLAAEVLATGKTCNRTFDGLHMLFEVIEPAPRLFIVGTGHDALPVAKLARSLDWEVIVCERHKRVGTQERFAGIAEYRAGTACELSAEIDRAARPLALIMSHRYEFDREMLGTLLQGRAQYLGVLGPARRTERMLGELAAAGTRIEARARQCMHAPVGLDLGAETPAEIALSVIAEAQACLANADGQSLRRRRGGIHSAASVVRLDTSLSASEGLVGVSCKA
jgi:xanthine dehydrogenase accessory factor